MTPKQAQGHVLASAMTLEQVAPSADAGLRDHARGCDGRNYTCTCGYDDARDDLLAEAREALRAVDLARHSDDPKDWDRATKLTDAALDAVESDGVNCFDCGERIPRTVNSISPCPICRAVPLTPDDIAALDAAGGE